MLVNEIGARRLFCSVNFAVCPNPHDLLTIVRSYQAIAKDKVQYHVGAYYLTDRARLIFEDSIAEDILGRLLLKRY